MTNNPHAPVDLDEVRKRHYRVEDQCGNEYCQCGASLANCDAIRLCDEVEQLRTENIRRTDMVIEMQKRRDRLREALEKIADWANAYPLDIFQEPSSVEWKEIAAVLKRSGFTLDAVSGSNLRHALKGVGEIARAALKEKP